MIDCRIYVRIEAVLVGVGDVPGGRWLVLCKFDLDQRFGALESVLPGDDHSDRRAVLIGQRFAVHADGQQRQRVHGFVQPQALDVGQVDSGAAPQGHLLLVEIRFECDVAGRRSGLHQLCQRAERIADPRHYDRPSLDAAVAVNALFERRELQDFVHREFAGLGDFALDRNRPRRGDKFGGIPGRIALIGAEFVIIIVGRHDLFVGDLLVGAERALGDALQLGGGVRTHGGEREIREAPACQRYSAC